MESLKYIVLPMTILSFTFTFITVVGSWKNDNFVCNECGNTILTIKSLTVVVLLSVVVIKMMSMKDGRCNIIPAIFLLTAATALFVAQTLHASQEFKEGVEDEKYDWSYKLGWVSVTFILITAVLLVVAHFCSKRDDVLDYPGPLPFALPKVRDNHPIDGDDHTVDGGTAVDNHFYDFQRESSPQAMEDRTAALVEQDVHSNFRSARMNIYTIEPTSDAPSYDNLLESQITNPVAVEPVAQESTMTPTVEQAPIQPIFTPLAAQNTTVEQAPVQPIFTPLAAQNTDERLPSPELIPPGDVSMEQNH